MNTNDRKIMFSHKTDEWGTPTDVYNRLNAEFNFNLDPCATELNHKCKKYYTRADNGLLADWGGAGFLLTRHTQILKRGRKRVLKNRGNRERLLLC